MTATVRIHWKREYDNNTMWNEVCAWAIEYFGLPGDRFSTAANVDYMDFHFNSPNYALLMSLRLNAEIVSSEKKTVEIFSHFLQ